MLRFLHCIFQFGVISLAQDTSSDEWVEVILSNRLFRVLRVGQGMEKADASDYCQAREAELPLPYNAAENVFFGDLGNTWVRINDDDAELTWRDDKTNLIVGYTEWCNEVAVNTQLQAAVLISASPIGCWANQPSQVVTTFTCVIDNSTDRITQNAEAIEELQLENNLLEGLLEEARNKTLELNETLSEFYASSDSRLLSSLFLTLMIRLI